MTAISPHLSWDIIKENSPLKFSQTDSGYFEFNTSKETIIKSHFGIKDLAELPVKTCNRMRHFVENYYDLDFGLLDSNYWLRLVEEKWSLKKVTQQSQINESIYILEYEKYESVDEIREIIRNVLPDKTLTEDENGLFKELKPYASFLVTRYSWKDDISVDVCEFGVNDYYVVGTWHPEVPGRIGLDAVSNINSKIIEYIKCKLPDVVTRIQHPKVLHTNKFGHYRSFPILTKPDYIKNQHKTLKQQEKELLQQIPENVKKEYQNHYAVLYSKDNVKSIAIFTSYRDAVHEHDPNKIVLIPPIPLEEETNNIFLDDLVPLTKRIAPDPDGDTRDCFVQLNLFTSDTEKTGKITLDCLVDTGSSSELTHSGCFTRAFARR